MNRHMIFGRTLIAATTTGLAVWAFLTIESDVWWAPVVHLVALVGATLLALYALWRVFAMRDDSYTSRVAVACLVLAVGLAIFGSRLIYDQSFQNLDNLLQGSALIAFVAMPAYSLRSLWKYLTRADREQEVESRVRSVA